MLSELRKHRFTPTTAYNICRVRCYLTPIVVLSVSAISRDQSAIQTDTTRPYTVRDQVCYSWHGTTGLCWNTNTVSRRDWKIGSISLPFNNLLSRPSFHSTQSLDHLLHGGLPPIRRGSCHLAGRRSSINTFLSYHISTYRSISHVSPMWSHHRGDSSTSTFSCKENRSPLFRSNQNRIITRILVLLNNALNTYH